MRIEKDISYVSNSKSRKHKLDIYCPADSSEPRPVVLFVHGGSWRRGDKKHYLNLYGNVGEEACSRGFVGIVMSYRLSALPLAVVCTYGFLIGFAIGYFSTADSHSSNTSFGGLSNVQSHVVIGVLCGLVLALLVFLYRVLFSEPVKHPEHMNDVLHAMTWVKANIVQYGGDPSKVYLAGHSAGAHLVSLIALHKDRQRLFEERGLELDFIKGLMLLCGVYDIHTLATKNPLFTFQMAWPAFGVSPQVWREASPVYHARALLYGLAQLEEEGSVTSSSEPQPRVTTAGLLKKTDSLVFYDSALNTTKDFSALAHTLPPVIFVNAQFDLGLEKQTKEILPIMEQLLRVVKQRDRSSKFVVESAVISRTEHLSLVRMIGTKKSDRVSPVAFGFLERIGSE